MGLSFGSIAGLIPFNFTVSQFILILLKRSNHICPIHSITQLINLNNDYDSSKCITCNSNLNNLFGQWGEETLVNLRK